MARNLGQTACGQCGCDDIVLEEERRDITANDCGPSLYRHYKGMQVAHARCARCGARYIAWMGEIKGRDLPMHPDAVTVIYDLSYRSTFNDEPGDADITNRALWVPRDAPANTVVDAESGTVHMLARWAAMMFQACITSDFVAAYHTAREAFVELRAHAEATIRSDAETHAIRVGHDQTLKEARAAYVDAQVRRVLDGGDLLELARESTALQQLATRLRLMVGRDDAARSTWTPGLAAALEMVEDPALRASAGEQLRVVRPTRCGLCPAANAYSEPSAQCQADADRRDVRRSGPPPSWCPRAVLVLVDA
jgi:hypothetical protein